MCSSDLKDCFPRLLKKLMTAFESRQEENLQAGFRKCGIVPFNPDTVLASIPDEQRVAGLPESVSDTFIDHLKHLRNTGKSTTGRKKKKLTIAPGKSFTETTTDDDTQDEDIHDEMTEVEEMQDMTTQDEEIGRASCRERV